MDLKLYTCEEVSDYINGTIIIWNYNKLIGSFSSVFEGLIENSLFFLYDKSFSEEKLISILVRAKASGVVFEKGLYSFSLNKWAKAGLGVIEVDYINDAFMRMASLYTLNANIPIVQVIGSSGKTTTKEMLGSILRYNMPTAVGADNLNTSMGIAGHISFLRNYHRAAVYEAGMNGPGVMRLSTSIINPTIGIITSIHRAHLFKFGGSIDTIIAAKSEMLEYLAEGGYLIINGEDENCKKVPVDSYNGNVLTFGFSDKCDIWASNIETDNFRTKFTANTKNMHIRCTINTIGKYNVANALAAIMAATIIGVKGEKIVKGLSTFTPYTSRLEMSKGIFNTTVINDNFNANPDSTRMLIEEIPDICKGRPTIMVIGDMENPNDDNRIYARKVHFEIGELVGRLKVQYLFAIGKWAGQYANGALSSGMDYGKVFYFKNVEQAKDEIMKSIIPNSVIIFKSSFTYVDLTPLIDMVTAEEVE